MSTPPNGSADRSGRGSRLQRVIGWLSRSRAAARARRSVDELDPRILRDIGLTRQEALFFSADRSRS